MDAPKGTCSEPPSLKSGENTVQKDYLSENLIENGAIVKSLKCVQANIGMEISRSSQENLYLHKNSGDVDAAWSL